jgi:parallel beta-helix repeat protein
MTLTVSTGNLFNVTVSADNLPLLSGNNGLCGVAFRLTWNATVLQGVKMTEIMFHSTMPNQTEIDENLWRLNNKINNSEGNLDYAYTYINISRAVSNGYAPITGNHTLAMITFNATTPGSTQLHISWVKMGDVNENVLADAYVIDSTIIVNKSEEPGDGGPAKANGTIYIRADGSIDPPTASIQRNGDAYTLTGNITSVGDGIVIERDNMTLDGAGYEIQGTNPQFFGSNGIYLSNRRNVTLGNLNIGNFSVGIALVEAATNNLVCENNLEENYCGISLGLNGGPAYCLGGNIICRNNISKNRDCGFASYSSSNNSIIGNNIGENYNIGIRLLASSVNTLRQNNMFDNPKNFGVVAWQLTDFPNDIDTSNTIDGKPIFYLMNKENVTVDPSTAPDIGYLAVINSTGITVRNLTLGKNIQGIMFAYTTNSTVMGNSLTQNDQGILLWQSSNNTIYENNATDNVEGILLEDSSYNTLRNNRMDHNYDCNFHLDTDYRGHAEDLFNDVDASNKVDGKPICYWTERHNASVPLDAGFVALVNCSDITVQNLDLANNRDGIFLAFTTSSTVVKNTVKDNELYGIELYYSSDNFIGKNTVTAGGGPGIQLFYSFNNNISQNIIRSNMCGMELYMSSNNIISHNTITNCNSWSFNLYSSNNNGIQENYVEDGAMVVGESSNNTFYHNNFLMSFCYVHDSQNVWDDDYPSGGNYWGDYNGTDLFRGSYQNETGADGIGDIPYVMDANNTDKYPLMTPWTDLFGDTNHDGTVDIYDAVLLAGAFNSKLKDPNWNASADFNGDDVVDIYDAIILSNNYGKTFSDRIGCRQITITS